MHNTLLMYASLFVRGDISKTICPIYLNVLRDMNPALCPLHPDPDYVDVIFVLSALVGIIFVIEFVAFTVAM